MVLRMRRFFGIWSEVRDEIAEWSKDREGKVVSVESKFDNSVAGCQTEVIIWHWDEV